ncbi:MAG: hypothetical protein MK100_08515 [Phycisphaerales bacterium]|nr:hypothetical protein [Phycisphaerales bacterium]
MTMPATLSLLLDGLIDYAGLFPPAKLEMEPMVTSYRRAMLDPRGWMVGRVIVPVSRLEEFEAAAKTLLPDEEESEPWCISALTRPCADDGLVEDLERIAAFNDAHALPSQGRAVIDVIELVGGTAMEVDAALDQIPDELFPFIEMPLTEDARGVLAVLAGAEAAAKIRTGGIRPELYPDSLDVAAFIHSAAAAGVPFKATAGMHHPLPNDNPDIPARQHGFIGVFLAAALAHGSDVDVDLLQQIIELDDPEAFVFEENSVRVAGIDMDRDQIEEARLSFAISYGSCSVDEPWEDLESIGWLDAVEATS